MAEGPTEMKSNSEWKIYLGPMEVFSFSPAPSGRSPTLFKIFDTCSLWAACQRRTVALPLHQLSIDDLNMMQQFLEQLSILESYQILCG